MPTVGQNATPIDPRFGEGLMSKKLILLFMLLVNVSIVACGGSGGSNTTSALTSSGQSSSSSTVSTVLKIFVTASTHVGDFKNDPLLQGTNAISKADYFCNKDVNNPDNRIYKALIVDGIEVDPIGWTVCRLI